MQYAIAALLASAAFAVGSKHHSSAAASGWSASKLKTLVTFGDSYTDENRLGYFINHNGSAPPVGSDLGIGYKTASGGLSWARYAAFYNDAKLYNYAVSGAVCSNDVSPRFFSTINAPFPDIQNYELPAFIADSKYVRPNGTKFFTGTADNTVYVIWIGTNDLGNYAFITDSQVAGTTLANYTDCIYQTIDGLYKNGARYFVLNNNAPLQLLPQYAVPSAGGLSRTQYWPDKPSNITEISYRMLEQVTLVNQVEEYRTPYVTSVSQAYPGIKIANFDVNALLTSIYNNPSQYLNGTAPANVTGYANQCDANFKNCVVNSSPDSFEWFDELHPSEQTGRVIAREFVNVLNGNSTYAAYWG